MRGFLIPTRREWLFFKNNDRHATHDAEVRDCMPLAESTLDFLKREILAQLPMAAILCRPMTTNRLAKRACRHGLALEVVLDLPRPFAIAQRDVHCHPDCRLRAVRVSHCGRNEKTNSKWRSFNDVSKLPPEFSRAERFDGVFFLDLPSRAQKDAIWWQYLGHYQLDLNQPCPEDTHWTGAEIKSCCRLAALLDVPLAHAAQNVVPVAVTAAESVDRLRSWATARCLSAERPGIYQQAAKEVAGTRRRVNRKSINHRCDRYLELLKSIRVHFTP